MFKKMSLAAMAAVSMCATSAMAQNDMQNQTGNTGNQMGNQSGNNMGMMPRELDTRTQFMYRARKTLHAGDQWELMRTLRQMPGNAEEAIMEAVNRASDQSGARIWDDTVAMGGSWNNQNMQSGSNMNSAGSPSGTGTGAAGSGSNNMMNQGTATGSNNQMMSGMWGREDFSLSFHQRMARNWISDREAYNRLTSALDANERGLFEREWTMMTMRSQSALLQMVRASWAVTPMTMWDMERMGIRMR